MPHQLHRRLRHPRRSSHRPTAPMGFTLRPVVLCQIDDLVDLGLRDSTVCGRRPLANLTQLHQTLLGEPVTLQLVAKHPGRAPTTMRSPETSTKRLVLALAAATGDTRRWRLQRHSYLQPRTAKARRHRHRSARTDSHPPRAGAPAPIDFWVRDLRHREVRHHRGDQQRGADGWWWWRDGPPVATSRRSRWLVQTCCAYAM